MLTMTTTNSLRAALKRLTIMASNELDTPDLWAHDRSQWNDAIAAARAALAQPVAEGVVLTDDQLDLLVIAIQALAPHQPDASSHDLAAVDQGRKILRNALARWGSGQVILDNSAPAPAVEVTDLRRTADLLEQHQPAPAPVTEPTDEQLLATVDAVTVTLPPLPMDHADAHGRINYDVAWRIAMARAVLARWGGQAARPAAGEVQP